jgi:aryl-phospho-beta-D-glucosidase BglC (GH1 family)
MTFADNGASIRRPSQTESRQTTRNGSQDRKDELMNASPIARVLCGIAWTTVLLLTSANAVAAGYTALNGRLYDPGGSEIQLRGISHYGFNSTILQPQYLWQAGWKEQIAEIQRLGFNAVRVPFVPDTLYSTATVEQLSYIDAGRNPELIGKTPLEALDLWMAEADRLGLYVLLDFHSVSMQRQYPTWFVSNPADFGLIYNRQAYTAENWRRDLVFVAKRYAHLRHFFAIDVYNEPNGVVRWSTGDPNMTDPGNYWKGATESAATAILAANPNLLIFVQGITGNFDGVENTNTPMNWGENFQPQAYQPLNIPYDKLVLSPHTYGPDVYVKQTFEAPDFPANLSADWERLFGQFAPIYAVVPGEWGGRYGQGNGDLRDVRWQNAFVDYLISKGIRNSFYWCYTPNSGDTGGILDDSLAVQEGKMALLRRLWGGESMGTAASPSTATVSSPITATASSPSTATAPSPSTTQSSSSSVTPEPFTNGGGAADLLLLLALAAAALARGRTVRLATRV